MAVKRAEDWEYFEDEYHLCIGDRKLHPFIAFNFYNILGSRFLHNTCEVVPFVPFCRERCPFVMHSKTLRSSLVHTLRLRSLIIHLRDLVQQIPLNSEAELC